MGRYLLLFVVLLAGCGPIRVTVGLVDAERAVREAKDAGAETHAVYPGVEHVQPPVDLDAARGRAQRAQLLRTVPRAPVSPARRHALFSFCVIDRRGCKVYH